MDALAVSLLQTRDAIRKGKHSLEPTAAKLSAIDSLVRDLRWHVELGEQSKVVPVMSSNGDSGKNCRAPVVEMEMVEKVDRIPSEQDDEEQGLGSHSVVEVDPV